MAAVKPGTKWQRNRKPTKDEPADKNPGEGSYFIQPKLRSFMAIQANLLLFRLWIWDTETFQDSICDRNLFLNFRLLVNFCTTKNLSRLVTSQDIEDIRLECKDQTGRTTSFLLWDAHFM